MLNITHSIPGIIIMSFAANALAAPPDTGALLQQLQPVPDFAPASPLPNIKQRDLPKLKNDTPFAIKGVRFVGNSLFSQQELLAQVQPLLGPTVTLSQLQRVCDLLGSFYREQGYPMVRAVVPKQEIADGVLTLQIVEAKLDRVYVNNNSDIDSKLLEKVARGLAEGEVIAQQPLDKTLLLFSDLPGTQIQAVIQPGSELGSSQIQINTQRQSQYQSLLKLDNHGSRYLGRERLSGAFIVNNPLGSGDSLAVNALTSGQRMGHLNLAYQTTLNGQGTTARTSVSKLRYRLGEELAQLDAHGDALTADFGLRHPLVRSRSVNVYGEIAANVSQLDDRVDSSSTQRERDVYSLNLSLAGNTRGLIPGGGSYWRVGFSAGQVKFNDPAARAFDIATADTEGGFSKLQLQLGHQQSLGNNGQLRLNFSAQATDDNLDSSQKLVLGGANSIAGYDTSATSGDTGYQASIRYQHNLFRGEYGLVQGEVFTDIGHVKITQKPWSNNSSTNGVTLQGAGAGLNWFGPDNWQGRLVVAAEVGGKPESLADVDTNRAWFELSKSFDY